MSMLTVAFTRHGWVRRRLTTAVMAMVAAWAAGCSVDNMGDALLRDQEMLPPEEEGAPPGIDELLAGDWRVTEARFVYSDGKVHKAGDGAVGDAGFFTFTPSGGARIDIRMLSVGDFWIENERTKTYWLSGGKMYVNETTGEVGYTCVISGDTLKITNVCAGNPCYPSFTLRRDSIANFKYHKTIYRTDADLSGSWMLPGNHGDGLWFNKYGAFADYDEKYISGSGYKVWYANAARDTIFLVKFKRDGCDESGYCASRSVIQPIIELDYKLSNDTLELHLAGSDDAPDVWTRPSEDDFYDAPHLGKRQSALSKRPSPSSPFSFRKGKVR